jgi:hypothetical protein
MIRQTIAIFLDAYRDLNARKLFWITLILSAVIVGSFAMLGVKPDGLGFLSYTLPVRNPVRAYNGLFQFLVIGIWLTWIATILAIISTAGIFPDLISGGSIDLYLSKPIGRMRLFLTKYLSGLLFVTLQVLVVATGSFITLGLRGHEWMPRLFLAVPIVVCFFSYLFAICVFLGVITRSTIAALLITILCWGLFAVLDWAEPAVLATANVYESQARQYQQDAQEDQANVLRAEQDPKSSALLPSYREAAETSRREAESTAHTARIFRVVQRSAYGIKTVTPKTTDTIDYLYLKVFKPEEQGTVDPDTMEQPRRGPFGPIANASARQTVREVNARSAGWIIGTSLLFEGVLVGAAMWIFVRRDY